MHRNGNAAIHGLMRVSLAALIALLWCSTFAAAQNEDTSNAATWYERASKKREGIPSEDLLILYRYVEQAGPPSAQVREMMRRVAPMLSDIRRGANLGFADFAPRYAPNGFRIEQAASLYHFTPFIDADIKMKIADGDTVGAASQIASMYRLMAHAGDGHTVYSSRTAAALNLFTEAALDSAMEDSALGPAEMTLVLDAMHSLDPKDPFQLVNALAWQQAEAERLLQQANQPNAQITALQVMRAIGTPINSYDGLTDLSEEARFGVIVDYGNLLGQFIKIESSDDPKWAAEEIDRLKGELENGTLAPILADVLRVLLQQHAGNLHARQLLEDRKAQLAKLAQGQIDPDQLANAAVYYRRGIAHLDSLDLAWSAAVDAMLEGNEALSAETLAALKEANRQAVDHAIAEFTKGSLIRRCDFSTRRLEDELFIPAYSNGMRHGFALLCIEAMSLDAQGRPGDALAQLATCFRMIGHLGGDGLILSAMESQDGFTLARQTAQQLIDRANAPAEDEERAKVDPTGLAELANAIRRTGPRDPFGFGAAVNAIGRKVKLRLDDMIVRGNTGFDPFAEMSPEQKAAIQRAATWIEGLDPAQRWYAFGLVMLNSDWDTEIKDRLRSRASSYNRPVISLILDLAEVDAEALRVRFKDERLATLAVPPVDDWLNLSERAARAVSDQREGMALADSLTELSRSQFRKHDRLAMFALGGLASAATHVGVEAGE